MAKKWGDFLHTKRVSCIKIEILKKNVSSTLSKETRMQYSRIAGRIRAQIRRFSGELSTGISKPARRFVTEAVYGIGARQSVLLSEIARSLNEDITFKKTEDRLSREINREGLGGSVEENLLSMASKRIKEDTLLIVDLSDISKRYAHKMEYMAGVHDGSTGGIGNGYWTLQIVGTESEGVHITPLLHRLYSQKAPDFDSENDEIMAGVRTVHTATGGRGIYVIDRGADRKKLLHPLLERKARFIIRMVGTRHLVYRGRHILASELGMRCPMLFREQVVREENGKEKGYQIEYGYRSVRLPGREEKLTLVVVRGFGQRPMLLLTSVDVKRTRKSVYFIVHAYLKRWHVEETIRCMKQTYDLENIRLLKYRSLQNMIVLVLCAMYFAAVQLGDSIRLGVLAHHALKEAKRLFGIPDFRYYAMADGIKTLLEGFRRPFMEKEMMKIETLQTSLFAP